VLDGEVVASDTDGRPNFARLHVRWTRPGTIYLWAFDLLVFNGRDLRPQPLVKRQARLQALLERFGCLAVSLSEPFEDGLALLRVAQERGLEGIVSKRRDAPYCSGECRDWRKVKTAVWREANRERWRSHFARARWPVGRTPRRSNLRLSREHSEDAGKSARLDGTIRLANASTSRLPPSRISREHGGRSGGHLGDQRIKQKFLPRSQRQIRVGLGGAVASRPKGSMPRAPFVTTIRFLAARHACSTGLSRNWKGARNRHR